MKMLKAVVIDDEAPARNLIKIYLQKFSNIELVGEASNGFEGLKVIQNEKPDLLILDIKMPKITGMELLELLDPKPVTIFTTAFDEYAIKAFEMNAIDYILKPYTEGRFDSAVNKALEKMNSGNSKNDGIGNIELGNEDISRIVVRNGADIVLIPLNQIYYFEAQDDYVAIVSRKGKHLKQTTMKYFESVLPAEKFLKTHRSYIANMEEIDKIEPYTKDTHKAKMKNGDYVSISRSGYKSLKEKLDI